MGERSVFRGRRASSKALNRSRKKISCIVSIVFTQISPDEFGDFIGDNIRLEKVRLLEDTNVEDVLAYYMGKNTPERQNFIIDRLRVEEDPVEVA